MVLSLMGVIIGYKMSDVIVVLICYFDVFNVGDIDGMLVELVDDVVYYVNEGQVCVGKVFFVEFCVYMFCCYGEILIDIVIFGNDDGICVVVEFIVNGMYLEIDEGLFDVYG